MTDSEFLAMKFSNAGTLRRASSLTKRDDCCVCHKPILPNMSYRRAGHDRIHETPCFQQLVKAQKAGQNVATPA